MRKLRTILFIALFVFLCTGAEAPGVHTGAEDDPFVIFNLDTIKVAADAYTVVLSGIELQLELQQGVSWVPVATATNYTTTPAGTTPKIPFYTEIVPHPDGLYRFRMRVRNEALAFSEWSAWYYAQKDWTSRPPAPTGCWLLRD